MADSFSESVPFRTKIGYGAGHIMNDMCASMWFTYLLLFFHKVLQFDNTLSGVILLIGQLADGISTVFVGILSNIYLISFYERVQISDKSALISL